MSISAWLGGYLLGSIPFGIIWTRVCGTTDPRTIGSGNIGATNVLRTGKKEAALLTLLCDGGKGALAVYLWGETAALPAFLGHLYPVWLKGRGGKGVATFLGMQFMLWGWDKGLLLLLCWLSIALLTKRSSAAALTTAIVSLIGNAEHNFCMVLLLFWRHRDNIKRLWLGVEPPISFGSAAAPDKDAPL